MTLATAAIAATLVLAPPARAEERISQPRDVAGGFARVTRR